jgi:hypothetical protein
LGDDTTVLLLSALSFRSQTLKHISRRKRAFVPCIGGGGTLQWSGDLTGKTRQRRLPLLLIGRLARTEVDAQRPEFCSAARLRSATENVRLPGDLEVDESGSHDRGLQFCFQQSTGNSARPQIDLLFRVRWHRLLHQDIPDLETARGFEHASHLLQGREFVWQQVEGTVGDDHIGPAIKDG